VSVRGPEGERPSFATLSHSAKTSGPSYVVYTGRSMNPTLRQSDLIEVVSDASRSLRIGDVILFESPDDGECVVHRITHISSQGIGTRGDNNSEKDPYALRPGDVMGRVVAAWLGQRRRQIAGGWVGRVASYLARRQLAIDRRAQRLTRWLSGVLSHRGMWPAAIADRLKPRVVVFRTEQAECWRVLMGSIVVGRYDFCRRQWRIRWPYRPFVDESSLPGPREGSGSMVHGV
jgi:hypothetical protein